MICRWKTNVYKADKLSKILNAMLAPSTIWCTLNSNHDSNFVPCSSEIWSSNPSPKWCSNKVFFLGDDTPFLADSTRIAAHVCVELCLKHMKPTHVWSSYVPPMVGPYLPVAGNHHVWHITGRVEGEVKIHGSSQEVEREVGRRSRGWSMKGKREITQRGIGF